jgi:hypothetical protein
MDSCVVDADLADTNIVSTYSAIAIAGTTILCRKDRFEGRGIGMTTRRSPSLALRVTVVGAPRLSKSPPPLHPPRQQRIVPAGRHQPVPLRRERDAEHTGFMPAQHLPRLAGAGLPETHRAVPARCRDQFAVRRPGHTEDSILVPCQIVLHFAGHDAPEARLIAVIAISRSTSRSRHGSRFRTT